jgi:hypothetical protein
MDKDKTIKLFEEKSIRTHWDAEAEKWYFSIVDVCAVLADSDRPRKYWGDLKKKLNDEGSQLSEKIGQLKMQAADGKFYNTDVADTEQLLRLVQSIPSKKAEPFKLWLARVQYEQQTGKKAVSPLNARNLKALADKTDAEGGSEE